MQSIRSWAPTMAMLLTLTGCLQNSNESTPEAHADTPNASISTDNALTIAAAVYRVAAMDVPYTASIAMKADGSVNPDACASGTIGGSDGMIMNGMEMMGGMDMVFENCQLTGTASSHAVTVDGDCFNAMESGNEVVSGSEVALSSDMQTLTLHAFAIKRDDTRMLTAEGTLHGLGDATGEVVTFNTLTDFQYNNNDKPNQGVLLITGANGSQIRLSADNETQFTLETDADGDGFFDTDQPYNWGCLDDPENC